MDKRAKDSWLGHLERMEEYRMPKKHFTQELEGTRSRGRPRKRWKSYNTQRRGTANTLPS